MSSSPKEPRMYLVSRTYSETTPESVDQADFSDNGFEFEDTLMDREGVLRELDDCCELSAAPADPRYMNGHEWASTQWYITDYGTAEERQESVHIRNADGTTLDPEHLFWLYVEAGLAKAPERAPRPRKRRSGAQRKRRRLARRASLIRSIESVGWSRI